MALMEQQLSEGSGDLGEVEDKLREMICRYQEMAAGEKDVSL